MVYCFGIPFFCCLYAQTNYILYATVGDWMPHIYQLWGEK